MVLSMSDNITDHIKFIASERSELAFIPILGNSEGKIKGNNESVAIAVGSSVGGVVFVVLVVSLIFFLFR